MGKIVTKICISLIVAIAFGGCSKYQKIRRSADWKVKYEAAIKYYEEKDYFRSGELLEEILPIIKGTEEAELGNFYYAYSYYHQGQFILSSHYFNTFVEVYSRSQYAMEASYMHAYSLYKQSPESSLDQTSTYEALTALQSFINKYPGSDYAKEADKIIDELQVKLEKKAYNNALLYYKIRRYKAAIVAFNNFKKDYPDSQYQEEIAYKLVQTHYDLAKVSISSKQEERFRNAIEDYQVFLEKYPNSEFLKDAETIYADSIEELSKFAALNN
ncbi:MAG: outer membrane protein assembly factor BamD [Cyclobacteriaceae bacterium]|nr:outer membrane protein assembly factor BamD [Cyclobacteriaceae bacterium HetDA_MAG_MS6]